MARGFDSKNVEEQQAEAIRPKPEGKQKSPEQLARDRERHSLRLQISNARQRLGAAQNDRHRQMLEQAIAELEQKLAKLQ